MASSPRRATFERLVVLGRAGLDIAELQIDEGIDAEVGCLSQVLERPVSAGARADHYGSPDRVVVPGRLVELYSDVVSDWHDHPHEVALESQPTIPTGAGIHAWRRAGACLRPDAALPRVFRATPAPEPRVGVGPSRSAVLMGRPLAPAVVRP